MKIIRNKKKIANTVGYKEYRIWVRIRTPGLALKDTRALFNYTRPLRAQIGLNNSTSEYKINTEQYTVKIFS